MFEIVVFVSYIYNFHIEQCEFVLLLFFRSHHFILLRTMKKKSVTKCEIQLLKSIVKPTNYFLSPSHWGSILLCKKLIINICWPTNNKAHAFKKTTGSRINDSEERPLLCLRKLEFFLKSLCSAARTFRMQCFYIKQTCSVQKDVFFVSDIQYKHISLIAEFFIFWHNFLSWKAVFTDN